MAKAMDAVLRLLGLSLVFFLGYVAGAANSQKAEDSESSVEGAEETERVDMDDYETIPPATEAE